MLASTSSTRFTSSIRGILLSVVVPRFKSDAHKSPTAEFFEVLMRTLPCRRFPPSILKFMIFDIVVMCHSRESGNPGSDFLESPYFLRQICRKFFNFYPFLLCRIAVAHRYIPFLQRVKVNRDAIRRADFVLRIVPLADIP